MITGLAVYTFGLLQTSKRSPAGGHGAMADHAGTREEKNIFGPTFFQGFPMNI
jgi:hypothetical protein